MRPCETCRHWRPYWVAWYDDKERKARREEGLRCELDKTPRICGSYEERESEGEK